MNAELTPMTAPAPTGLRRWAIRILRTSLILMIAVAVLYGVLLWWMQDRIIYHPQATDPATAAAALATGAERLRYTSDAAEQIAWLLPPDPAAPRVLWIACLGNADCAARWFEQPDYLLPTLRRRTGAAILAVDYPGYGECPGIPTPERILAQTRAAQAAALGRLGWSRDQVRLGAIGWSLGTGAATQHAAAEGIDRLLLISPYTSLLDLAKQRHPWPYWHLLRHRFDNRAALAQVAQMTKGVNTTRLPGAEVAIYHGDRDSTIPVSGSRELATTFPELIRYHEIPGAGHSDVLDRAFDQALADLVRMSRMTE